ncbi:hypothetical protein ACFL20_05665 [Spirochaetota bacterium]
MSTFKIDAIFYVIGIFIGVFVFGEAVPYFESFFKGANSMYMGRITIYQALGVSAGVVGFFVILMALGGFWGSEWIEKKFGKSES